MSSTDEIARCRPDTSVDSDSNTRSDIAIRLEPKDGSYLRLLKRFRQRIDGIDRLIDDRYLVRRKQSRMPSENRRKRNAIRFPDNHRLPIERSIVKLTWLLRRLLSWASKRKCVSIFERRSSSGDLRSSPNRDRLIHRVAARVLLHRLRVFHGRLHLLFDEKSAAISAASSA